jgi:hypothetical protein
MFRHSLNRLLLAIILLLGAVGLIVTLVQGAQCPARGRREGQDPRPRASRPAAVRRRGKFPRTARAGAGPTSCRWDDGRAAMEKIKTDYDKRYANVQRAFVGLELPDQAKLKSAIDEQWNNVVATSFPV